MDAGTLFLFAVASLTLWMAANLAMLCLNRVVERRFPTHLRAEADSFLPSLRDAFVDLGEAPWLGMAAIVGASFLFAATEFSLLFSVVFWSAVGFYFAFFEVRSLWTERVEAASDLGPPTRRTVAWASGFGLLIVLMNASWIAMLACLGAALAELAGL